MKLFSTEQVSKYHPDKYADQISDAILESRGNAIRKKRYNYIAVDFDGTLCVHQFPEIGEPIPEMIAFIREKHAEGTKIILYTCRDDSEERAYLQEAIDWCFLHDIPIDAANENPWVPFGKKKLYADIYIDDRAVSPWEIML